LIRYDGLSDRDFLGLNGRSGYLSRLSFFAVPVVDCGFIF
jgi:hypothetical protein